MRNPRPHGPTVFAALALAATAGAQTVSFEIIDDSLSADDMSPDGRFVVGLTDVDDNGFPDGGYHLDTLSGTMTFMPGVISGSGMGGVSDDGQVVLGNVADPDNGNAQVAALWSPGETEWTTIGFLPTALPCPSLSTGYELSADGSVAVGLSWDGCNGFGFIWTQATGMLPLENLANGTNRASVVSADGTVVGGFAQGSFSRTPCTWDGTTQDGTLLDPPNGDALGEVHGLSDDGTILLGEIDDDAFRKVGGGPIEILGTGSLLPGWQGIATDIADDGTIVGYDFLPGPGARRAWIQPQGTGPLRDLKTYVEAFGGTVPGGLILEVCQAISADGRYIVGHGFGTGAWRVTIVPDCPADTDGNGSVDIDDVVNIVLCFGTDGVDCPGPGVTTDVDGTGTVDIDDVITAVLAFGDCPGT